MSNTYHISAYVRRRHSRVIHPCHVDIRPTICSARRFRLSICLFISAEVGLLCKQVFLDLGKTNIGDLLAIIYHSTSCGSCTECSKLLWVCDWRWRSSDKYFSVSRALQIWFISSKVTANKYRVSGITCHMYSREERTRLTGEINYMSAFIPGAERYFRRSLHVKNCRDRHIILSGFQEKGGCPLIRACSVITSNTVIYVSIELNLFLYRPHYGVWEYISLYIRTLNHHTRNNQTKNMTTSITEYKMNINWQLYHSMTKDNSRPNKKLWWASFIAFHVCCLMFSSFQSIQCACVVGAFKLSNVFVS